MANGDGNLVCYLQGVDILEPFLDTCFNPFDESIMSQAACQNL